MTKTVSDLKKEYTIDLSSGQTESLRGINNPRKDIKELRAEFPHLLAKDDVKDMPSYALNRFNKNLDKALNNKPVNPSNIVAKQSLYDR